jgi:TM2 domain-containing membrane protein YozV
MADVFLSYSSRDRERARTLAEELRSHDLTVWWDRELLAGKHFDQSIQTELEAARCVLVLWSTDSIASTWVRAEASRAQERDMLIPVLIERVEKQIPVPFNLLHGVQLTDWQPRSKHQEFGKLLERISALIARPLHSNATVSKGYIYPASPPKSRLGATLTSVIVPGIGQAYLGQWKKGFMLFGLTVAIGAIATGGGSWILFSLVGAIDAWKIGSRLKAGRAVGEMEIF